MVDATPFRKPQPRTLSRPEFKRIVCDMVDAGKIQVKRHLYRTSTSSGILKRKYSATWPATS